MIVVNRQKAEEITRNRLRKDREPVLAALDIELMLALESGQETTGIAAKKQALRDLPNIDMSKLSIDELASLTVSTALDL